MRLFAARGTTPGIMRRGGSRRRCGRDPRDRCGRDARRVHADHAVRLLRQLRQRPDHRPQHLQAPVGWPPGAHQRRRRPGPAGPAGPQGDPGPQGVAGPAGATGLQGTQGVAGPAGATGQTGPHRPRRRHGLQGVAGPQGNSGATGLTGPAGATASRASQVLRAIPAPPDPRASRATRALASRGNTGTTSTAGVQGDAGTAGTASMQGNTGSASIKGATGSSGGAMAMNTYRTSQTVTLGEAPRFARCTNGTGTVAMTLPAAASNTGLTGRRQALGSGDCTPRHGRRGHADPRSPAAATRRRTSSPTGPIGTGSQASTERSIGADRRRHRRTDSIRRRGPRSATKPETTGLLTGPGTAPLSRGRREGESGRRRMLRGEAWGGTPREICEEEFATGGRLC